MMWTTFVAILVARIVGDVIWHFAQLWLVKQAWYQTIVSKISIGFTKKLMEKMDEEEC